MTEAQMAAQGMMLLVRQSIRQTAEYLRDSLKGGRPVDEKLIEVLRDHFAVIEQQDACAKRLAERCAPKKRRR